MGAYACAQNVLSDDTDRLTLLSNKQSDNDVISSFAYVLNRPGIGGSEATGEVGDPTGPG